MLSGLETLDESLPLRARMGIRHGPHAEASMWMAQSRHPCADGTWSPLWRPDCRLRKGWPGRVSVSLTFSGTHHSIS